VHEEGAYSCGLGRGVKQGINDVLGLIASEEGPTATPSSAGHQSAVAFRDVVALIEEQLGVDTKDVGDERLDLGGRVVPTAELPGGGGDQRVERRNFGQAGRARAIGGRVRGQWDTSTRSNV
jgi:hypothetical protein